MPKLLARAEFRDAIRRQLGIVPPIDIPGSGAAAGDQPVNYPYPTNMQINDALNNTISDTNTFCGFHVTGINVPVNAVSSSTLGPFGMYMGDLTPNTTGLTTAYLPLGKVNDIQRVTWTPTSGGFEQLLQPVYRDNLDRANNSNYYNVPASAPAQWYIEGYTLYITPAMNQAGTLGLTCCTGVTSFNCDTDTLDQVPIDYQPILQYGAIALLSDTQTMDVEAQTRAAAFKPRYYEGLEKFKQFIFGGTGASSPTMVFASYRGGYGVRRVVR